VRDDGVRLGEGVRDADELEIVLAHGRRVPEGRFDVAERLIDLLVDVRAADRLLVDGIVGRLERVLHPQDRRQHLVIDVDQGQRLEGDLLVVGGHRGDAVADVLRLADGERRLVARDGEDAELARGFRADDRRADAGERERLRGVDPADACVRVRGTQDLPTSIRGA
jgi:hypothetical protein